VSGLPPPPPPPIMLQIELLGQHNFGMAPGTLPPRAARQRVSPASDRSRRAPAAASYGLDVSQAPLRFRSAPATLLITAPPSHASVSAAPFSHAWPLRSAPSCRARAQYWTTPDLSDVDLSSEAVLPARLAGCELTGGSAAVRRTCDRSAAQCSHRIARCLMFAV